MRRNPFYRESFIILSCSESKAKCKTHTDNKGADNADDDSMSECEREREGDWQTKANARLVEPYKRQAKQKNRADDDQNWFTTHSSS